MLEGQMEIPVLLKHRLEYDLNLTTILEDFKEEDDQPLCKGLFSNDMSSSSTNLWGGNYIELDVIRKQCMNQGLVFMGEKSLQISLSTYYNKYSISIHINSNSLITNKFQIYVGLFTVGFMNSILCNNFSKHFRDKGGWRRVYKL